MVLMLPFTENLMFELFREWFLV